MLAVFLPEVRKDRVVYPVFSQRNLDAGLCSVSN